MEKIFPKELEVYDILKVIPMKNEQIIVYYNGDNEHTLSFVHSKYPFELVQTIQFTIFDCILKIHELSNSKILIVFKKNMKISLSYYNQKGKEETKVEIDTLFSIINMIEIEKKFFFELKQKIVIYNPRTNQIESKLCFKDRITRIQQSFVHSNWFCVIFKTFFSIYDNDNFQQIFSFQHNLPYITNYLLLNNGTLLGLYDWKLQYVKNNKKHGHYHNNNFGSLISEDYNDLDEVEQSNNDHYYSDDEDFNEEGYDEEHYNSVDNIW